MQTRDSLNISINQMDLRQAILERSSVRAFTDKPIPEAVLTDLLTVACNAPSGGNLQPWHIYVAVGAERDRLLQAVVEKQQSSQPFDTPEFSSYPTPVNEPYLQRQRDCGYGLYAELGIARDDKEGRMNQTLRNFTLFGAPVALFFYVDRGMASCQWGDIGMLMQNFMLLAKDAGLDTCAQLSWTNYHQVVSDFFQTPENLMLYSGMALGYIDESKPAARYRTTRVPLSEVATIKGYNNT